MDVRLGLGEKNCDTFFDLQLSQLWMNDSVHSRAFCTQKHLYGFDEEQNTTNKGSFVCLRSQIGDLERLS